MVPPVCELSRRSGLCVAHVGPLFSTLGVVGRGSCGCLLVVSLAYCGGGGDGLYALSGRSRSGKAADSFRMWVG